MSEAADAAIRRGLERGLEDYVAGLVKVHLSPTADKNSAVLKSNIKRARETFDKIIEEGEA